MRPGRMTLMIVAALFALLFALPCAVSAAETENGSAVLSADMSEAEALERGLAAAQRYYLGHKELKSYWAVWAAYACRDGDLSGYTYTMENDNPDHHGAKVLGIMAMGDNPYNYKGVNYVARAADPDMGGPERAFAFPVFHFLGLKAAGAAMSETEKEAYIDACIAQINDTRLGPDVGSWAMVALAPYIDDPVYGEKVRAAMVGFTEYANEALSSGSLAPMSGGSVAISKGCIITGLTGMMAAGEVGYDPTTNAPWESYRLLNSILPYALDKVEPNVDPTVYSHQYYLEFGDLYNVKNGKKPVWLSIRLEAEDMSDAIAAAEEKIAAEDRYSANGIRNLKAALAAAKAVDEEELNAAEPHWGERCYDLINATEQCREKADPAVFKDIDQKAWYAPAVNDIVEQRIMNGTSSTTFVPNGTLTRAMVVQILWNIEGCPAHVEKLPGNRIQPGDCPFRDIKSGDWYEASVLWAHENGVVNGMSDTAFAPQNNITREQMAAILYRYAQSRGLILPEDQGEAEFNDADAISSWAKEAVEALAKAGIVNGMGNGMFKPQGTATRAQMAQITCKLLGLEAE